MLIIRMADYMQIGMYVRMSLEMGDHARAFHAPYLKIRHLVSLLIQTVRDRSLISKESLVREIAHMQGIDPAICLNVLARLLLLTFRVGAQQSIKQVIRRRSLHIR